MNKEFAHTDQIDSAVKDEEIVHESDHLEKLIKQNQDTLEMMGYLMKMLAEKAAQFTFHALLEFSKFLLFLHPVNSSDFFRGRCMAVLLKGSESFPIPSFHPFSSDIQSCHLWCLSEVPTFPFTYTSS